MAIRSAMERREASAPSVSVSRAPPGLPVNLASEPIGGVGSTHCWAASSAGNTCYMLAYAANMIKQSPAA